MTALQPSLSLRLCLNRSASLLTATGLGLTACTMVGPTLFVGPGPGRTQASLAVDRQACMAQTDTALRPISLGPGMTTAKVQEMYNSSYGQCMADKGNLVAGRSAVSRLTPGMAEANPQNDSDSAAARRSLSNVIAEFARSCEGERIEAKVTSVTLAPSLHARLVTLSTPDGGMCFGQPGQNDYLLVKSGSSWGRLLAAEPGSIEVLAGRHAGRADVALHSLGMCVYTYRWNGAAYAQAASRDCATATPATMQTLPSAIRRR